MHRRDDVADTSDVEEEGEEGEGEAAEPAEEGEAGEGDGVSAGAKVFDYRRKILNYVAGSAGQEALVGKSLLRLPKVYGEDEEEEEVEEGAPPPTVPQGVTFELVDKGLNALDVPNVFYKEGASHAHPSQR